VNRRGLLEFVSAGVALAVLRPPMAAALRGHWPMTVIYDERYGDARAFADYFRGHGTAPLPTRGDGTALWYGGSGAALRQAGGAVAGLTAYSDLVIARSCGRELGLRLVFERLFVRDFDQTGYPNSGTAQSGPAGLIVAALSRPSSAPDASDHLVAWLLMPRTSG
jgi:hypothetical protein